MGGILMVTLLRPLAGTACTSHLDECGPGPGVAGSAATIGVKTRGGAGNDTPDLLQARRKGLS